MPRTVFELLFGLLGEVDENVDSVIFFADEAGAWQIPVDWPQVFPLWRACVAATSTPEEYALAVDARVVQLASHDRSLFEAAAGGPASSMGPTGSMSPR